MMTDPTHLVGPVGHRSPRSGPSSPAAGPRGHPQIDRFALTYLRRELTGRLRQTLLIALGLGFGIGLVITVTAASDGVSSAQSTVLHSLYGIGTDLTVTKTASATNNPAGSAAGGMQQNTLQAAGLGLFPATSITSIAHLIHVASAAGGLELSELTQSGGIPQTVTVDGVDLDHLGLGPLASDTLRHGHNFSPTNGSADVAILDVNYAAANKLTVGSALAVAGTTFHVIGLVNPAQQSGATDIYIPLARAQALAHAPAGTSLTNQVNVIYVTATGSNQIPEVQQEIRRLLPAVTITDTGDLASQVSGSLGSTADLTNDLGKWVAAAALLTAFAVASLLTTAAVNRRTRELGTLKALGWPDKRIITQIMSESAAPGLIGAVLGVAIGFAGAALVDAVAPKLSATVPQLDGSGGTTTVAVHLAAHVRPDILIAAILLAIAGALIAGATGARRATQLQPADSFARVD